MKKVLWVEREWELASHKPLLTSTRPQLAASVSGFHEMSVSGGGGEGVADVGIRMLPALDSLALGYRAKARMICICREHQATLLLDVSTSHFDKLSTGAS